MSYTKDIPIELIRVVSNTRKTFDPTKHAELVASIRANGLIQALVVREAVADDGGYYDLICGERRLRACREAGVLVLPCTVRDGLTDAQILEIQIIENAQREDISPLEECDAFQSLQTKYGYSHARIAERLGKPQGLVGRRLKLVDLLDDGKELLRSGAISVGVAEKLAVKSAKEQRREIKSLGRLADEVTFESKLAAGFPPIVNAPFDTNDPDLAPKIPACTDCPKRVAMGDFDEASMRGACPDGGCFRKKADITWVQFLKAAQGRQDPVMDQAQAKAAFAPGSGWISLDDVCSVTREIGPQEWEHTESTWRQELAGNMLPVPTVARNPRTLRGYDLYPAPTLIEIVRKHRPDLVPLNPQLEVPLASSVVKTPKPTTTSTVEGTSRVTEAAMFGLQIPDTDSESVLCIIACALAQNASVEVLNALGFFCDRSEAVAKIEAASVSTLHAVALGCTAENTPGIIDLCREEWSDEDLVKTPKKTRVSNKATKKKVKS
jgi:ParB/RepB/Spo0J family partition protein